LYESSKESTVNLSQKRTKKKTERKNKCNPMVTQQAFQNHSKNGIFGATRKEERTEKRKKMITERIEPIIGNIEISETGRLVDPFTDPEVVRLTACNLEMAVRNLMTANAPPECLVITADICTHKLMAIPTADGEVKVLVFE
jgi:hypothetical protein